MVWSMRLINVARVRWVVWAFNQLLWRLWRDLRNVVSPIVNLRSLFILRVYVVLIFCVRGLFRHSRLDCRWSLICCLLCYHIWDRLLMSDQVLRIDVQLLVFGNRLSWMAVLLLFTNRQEDSGLKSLHHFLIDTAFIVFQLILNGLPDLILWADLSNASDPHKFIDLSE